MTYPAQLKTGNPPAIMFDIREKVLTVRRDWHPLCRSLFFLFCLFCGLLLQSGACFIVVLACLETNRTFFALAGAFLPGVLCTAYFIYAMQGCLFPFYAEADFSNCRYTVKNGLLRLSGKLDANTVIRLEPVHLRGDYGLRIRLTGKHRFFSLPLMEPIMLGTFHQAKKRAEEMETDLRANGIFQTELCFDNIRQQWNVSRKKSFAKEKIIFLLFLLLLLTIFLLLSQNTHT